MSVRSCCRVLPIAVLLAACIDHSQDFSEGSQGGGSSSRPSSRATSRRATSGPAKTGGSGGSEQKVVTAKGALPDTNEFDALLGRIVKGSRVDYAAVQKERAILDRYLAGVSKADLSEASKAEKLAFYINAYNAKTLVMVLKYVIGKGPDGKDLAGVLAVKEAAGVDFFKDKEVIVSGQLMSLDSLEKQGRALGDPRIHFAVNCASISCPPLMNRAWKPATLDEDLDRATRAYFASAHGLGIRDRTIYTTKLLDWYKDDFGGASGAKNFLAHYISDEAKNYLDKDVAFLDYDWGLNKAQ